MDGGTPSVLTETWRMAPPPQSTVKLENDAEKISNLEQEDTREHRIFVSATWDTISILRNCFVDVTIEKKKGMSGLHQISKTPLLQTDGCLWLWGLCHGLWVITTLNLVGLTHFGL